MTKKEQEFLVKLKHRILHEESVKRTVGGILRRTLEVHPNKEGYRDVVKTCLALLEGEAL